MVFRDEKSYFSMFQTVFGCFVGQFKGGRSENGRKRVKFFSNKFVPNEFLMVFGGELVVSAHS